MQSEYSGKKVLIEFESVYHNAEVYINGKKAAYRPYGYTNFYVDTEGFLKYEAQNEIRVIARILTSQTAAGIPEQESTVRCTSGQVIRSTFR